MTKVYEDPAVQGALVNFSEVLLRMMKVGVDCNAANAYQQDLLPDEYKDIIARLDKVSAEYETSIMLLQETIVAFTKSNKE